MHERKTLSRCERNGVLRGAVQMCGCGGVHVTYGVATLNFPNGLFSEFVEALRHQSFKAACSPWVDVMYSNVTLHLKPAEFREFWELVEEGHRRLADVAFERLVASE